MRALLQKITLSIVLLAVGFLAGYLVRPPPRPPSTYFTPMLSEIRTGNNGNNVLTNPLLECETGKETISKGSIRPFSSKMKDAIQKHKQQGHIEFVSLYFRDLNNGTWFGINEEEKFRPASLLKVPIMLWYLKRADRDPQILEKQIIYRQNGEENHQFFTPPSQLEPGKEYTVKEAVESMIVNSDNRASNVLLTLTDESRLDELFDLLGVSLVSEDPAGAFISVRQYASFFRILFNASYVSQKMSEWGLRLLRDIKFNGGLRAGIPENIMVAHKFGEATNLDTGQVQFHDCGIVYYPNKPFLLCVMTRGRDMQELEGTVARISQQVFEEVDFQIKNGNL